MKVITREEVLAGALRKVVAAAEMGWNDGRGFSPYFISCMWLIQQYDCSITFTRDVGHHSSGWFKNPDFERCWHLSIRFFGEFNQKAVEKILDGIYGQHKHKVLVEGAFTKEGKKAEIKHYRVFLDQFLQPIVPQGEVYSRLKTESGWRSYSEVSGEKKEGKIKMKL